MTLKKGRNFPDKKNASRLSVYIRFGEISVRQIWHDIQQLPQDKNTAHFCTELGWREFSYSLLFHNPTLKTQNLQRQFDKFPWVYDADKLQAWQRGQTGIPLVDAGMRELWQTGYMHNRTRQVTASFLVKNLMIHWRYGADWFLDCLLDADIANNSAGWQWVAGSGADGAQYCRIFNPILQGKKYDPDGAYVKHFVPELKDVPVDYLFNPWDAPLTVLGNAKVRLGVNYPFPLVDFDKTRTIAENAFEAIKETL